MKWTISKTTAINLIKKGIDDESAGCWNDSWIYDEYGMSANWHMTAYKTGRDIFSGRWTEDFKTTEKTWERYGDINYDEMADEYYPSWNYATEIAENGISVIDTEWEQTVSAMFISAKKTKYRVVGIQCGWGSDGEPVVIPTSEITKI